MEEYYCYKDDIFTSEYAEEKMTRTYDIKGESITCDIDVKVCPHCGEELSGGDTIDEELRIFRDEYCRRVNMLTSGEIVNLRNILRLSQAEFAKLLGLKTRDIEGLEIGLIQTREIDDRLRLFMDNKPSSKAKDTAKEVIT